MSEYNTSACKTVGTCGVGESGANCVTEHIVTGDLEIVMVLRTVETNLCGNTGAFGFLVVNGEVAGREVITAKGSAVQASAKPGDRVAAIVHTFPLHNEIVCTTLGELKVELQQCDLVT